MFYVGTTDKYISYSATNGLTVKGNITATSGNIGDWKVGDSLYTYSTTVS